MHILIEKYHYPKGELSKRLFGKEYDDKQLRAALNNLFEGIEETADSDEEQQGTDEGGEKKEKKPSHSFKTETVAFNMVGYFYSKTLKDVVFVLPKVVLDDNDKVFGKCPEELLDYDPKKLEPSASEFLFDFSVEIYEAIKRFKKENPGAKSTRELNVAEDSAPQSATRTDDYLGAILSLLKFNCENETFLLFIVKNLHSGYNKINWTRTISRARAIIQDALPVYLNPVNRKRKVNFNEELLILYYSILNYISETYGKPVNLNFNFPRLDAEEIKRYMEADGDTCYGCLRLNQIKYKYFSDKSLQLWQLCYDFFDKGSHARNTTPETVLASSFHTLFEAIVDTLVGDKREGKTLLAGGKNLPDKSRIDHLYKDIAPIDIMGDAFYMIDSKYYNTNAKHLLVNEDGKDETYNVYKQHKYAQAMRFKAESNVSEEFWKDVKMRDDWTEGYNIIPNFFLSAYLDVNGNVDDSNGHGIALFKDNEVEESEMTDLSEDTKSEIMEFAGKGVIWWEHFENRLFDRDTMFLAHFKINLRYLIQLYGCNDANECEAAKKVMRSKFHDEINKILTDKYEFHTLKPKPCVSMKTFVQDHFKELNGKIYSLDDGNTLILALENNSCQNASLLYELPLYFDLIDLYPKN